MTDQPAPPARPTGARDPWLAAGRWIVANPIAAALLLTVAGTLYYFYAVNPLYAGLPITRWMWGRFEPQYNFEHGKLVPLIFLGLLWYHRKELIEAPRERCDWGLLFIGLGALFYCLGARTLQARVGMFSIPLIIYGSALFLWGRQVARIVLFPAAFLIFMIPVAALEQATFRLQFLITGSANAFCNLIGIKLYVVGTTLRAVDDSFGFEIAEGCSGIRSLMAMLMLAAVYAHLAQDRLWKKLATFGMSIVFAIIGNAGRIVTILLLARFVSPKLAGGLYHEYSGFIFFPIALGAMVSFGKLLNLKNTDRFIARLKDPARRTREKVSYDY